MSGMIPGMEVYCVVTYGHGMRDCNPRERERESPELRCLAAREAQDFGSPCSFLCSCRMYCRAREHAHAETVAAVAK